MPRQTKLFCYKRALDKGQVIVCIIKNLAFLKETSDLFPWFLGEQAMSYMIGVFLFRVWADHSRYWGKGAVATPNSFKVGI